LAKGKKKKGSQKSSLKKKGTSAPEGWLVPLWPTERDIMERPDRYKYVRKLIKIDGCVFCNSIKEGVNFESLVLYSGKLGVVIMNKFPYNTGHLLILPKRHTGDLPQLKKDENHELADLMQISSQILIKELGCQGLNLGLNHGAVAGAGIPEHLHWHIVPRWGGDTNFFPLIAETKALPETLEQTYNRLRPHFEKVAL